MIRVSNFWPHIGFIAFLMALVGLGLVYLQRPGPPTLDVESTIVAVGDSWIEGVGASEGKDMISILSERIGVPIVNVGKTGDTTADVLLRLPTDVLVHMPTIVIVHVGGNDVLYLRSRMEMEENIRRIVDQLLAAGSDVLLLGVRCDIVNDSCAEMFTVQGARDGVTLLARLQDGIIGNPTRMSDPVHPNGAGYAYAADRIEPLLREMLRAQK